LFSPSPAARKKKEKRQKVVKVRAVKGRKYKTKTPGLAAAALDTHGCLFKLLCVYTAFI
jgi:hypothetical protein